MGIFFGDYEEPVATIQRTYVVDWVRGPVTVTIRNPHMLPGWDLMTEQVRWILTRAVKHDMRLVPLSGTLHLGHCDEGAKWIGTFRGYPFRIVDTEFHAS